LSFDQYYLLRFLIKAGFSLLNFGEFYLMRFLIRTSSSPILRSLIFVFVYTI